MVPLEHTAVTLPTVAPLPSSMKALLPLHVEFLQLILDGSSSPTFHIHFDAALSSQECPYMVAIPMRISA